jgi:exodeoxyribonuclease V alpha subunit
VEQVYTIGESGLSPKDCASIRDLFNRVTRCRILCVTRVLDSGAERINSRLHRRAAQDAKLSLDRNPFLVGEPVMMLRNDYDRKLFNGDQGLIVNVRTQDSGAARMAVFPRNDNFAAFRVDALKENLELCYAMTVHKAQGSEFDAVAMIVPEKDIPILTREILYTAVSRARKSVIVIGAAAIMCAGISRPVERYSGVREKLAQFLKESRE